MEKIILKKILSKNPLTYGDPIEFEFASIDSSFIENSNEHFPRYKFSSVTEGTNLFSLNATAGDEFQAFTMDGIKFGFILRYQGFVDVDGDRHTWCIYNEEIQAYSINFLTTLNNVPIYLALNPEYKLSSFTTIKECLERAETLYNLQLEPYRKGMDNNRYNFLKFIFKSTDNYFYDSVVVNEMQLANNTKLRYFSSWYKMITGKFYQEEKLFKMKTVDGYDFVFGRINDVTALNGSVLQASQNDERLLTEPSYGVKDLIYGTDLAYLIGTNWSQEVAFENGVRISYPKHTINNNAYMKLAKLGATGDKIISFLGTRASNNLQNEDLPSRLQVILNGTNRNAGTGLVYDYICEGISLFVSPQYNNVKPNEFSSVLGTYEHTPEEWKQNLARVFTMVASGIDYVEEEIRTNFGYTYGSGQMIGSFSFTGWAKTSAHWASQFRGAATNISDDSNAVCTFQSPEDWMSVSIFESDEPDIPPGPEPEPTPVKKRTSKLNIKELSQMAIKNGVPLLGDVEKLQPFAFMSEYLEDFEMFDEDLGETRGFYFPLWNIENGTEEEVLEHFRKRSAFTIKKHKNEIEGFKAIDDARWNPIENYDRYETNSTKRSGKDTIKDMFDGVSVTNEYGKQESSNVTGEQTGSNTVGAHTSTTINEHAGFNSSDYQKNGKSTTDSGSQTSNSTVGARTDSVSIDAHTDNMTTEAREDVHETAYDNTTEFETHIHGNIGVTTATQMLEEAKDFYSKWNFYNKLFDLILSELAIYYEE